MKTTIKVNTYKYTHGEVDSELAIRSNETTVRIRVSRNWDGVQSVTGMFYAPPTSGRYAWRGLRLSDEQTQEEIWSVLGMIQPLGGHKPLKVAA